MGRGTLARRPRPPLVIMLGRPRVLGLVQGDLVEVEVPLDAGRAPPDEDWLSLFRECAEFPAELEEPWVEHGRLRFEVREEDLQRAWVAIRGRVAVTNRTYATARKQA